MADRRRDEARRFKVEYTDEAPNIGIYDTEVASYILEKFTNTQDAEAAEDALNAFAEMYETDVPCGDGSQGYRRVVTDETLRNGIALVGVCCPRSAVT